MFKFMSSASAGSSQVMKKSLPLNADAPVVLKASTGTARILAITVSAGTLYYGLDHDVHVVATDATEPHAAGQRRPSGTHGAGPRSGHDYEHRARRVERLPGQ